MMMVNSEFLRNSKFESNRVYGHEYIKKINQLSILYDKFIDPNDIKTQKIPKIIHQIWLGGKLPKKYESYCDSIRNLNPDYDYILWDDEAIRSLALKNRKKYDATKNLGMKSDIARLEILYKFGGVYFDTDFELFKRIPDSFLSKEMALGLAFGNKSVPTYGNAFIFSQQNSEILKDILEMEHGPTGLQNAEEIMNYLGPYKLTECVNKGIENGTVDILIFPSDIFYPWPSFESINPEDRYGYVTGNSIGIHHWEVSWIPKWRKLASKFYRKIVK